MPYQQLIPRPTDQLNNSQADIQGNFLEIYNWVAVNHGQFDTPFAGKHFEATFPENGAPTNTLIDEANVYSQQSALTGNTELAWQRENNGARIEWTGALPANIGWTRLPSGILLKWGQANSTGTNFTVVFPVAANTPVFTNTFVAFATPVSVLGVGVEVRPATLTNLQFAVDTYTLGFAPAASTIFYLVIGT